MDERLVSDDLNADPAVGKAVVEAKDLALENVVEELLAEGVQLLRQRARLAQNDLFNAVSEVGEPLDVPVQFDRHDGDVRTALCQRNGQIRRAAVQDEQIKRML